MWTAHQRGLARFELPMVAVGRKLACCIEKKGTLSFAQPGGHVGSSQPGGKGFRVLQGRTRGGGRHDKPESESFSLSWTLYDSYQIWKRQVRTMEGF